MRITMRKFVRINKRFSFRYRILQSMLIVSLLIAVLSCLLLIFPAEETATDASAEYDYTDMQMQITIAPFDKLEPPKFDEEALKAENSDFRAWLQIPDTEISLPVVQGTDNSYYLKHSFSKKYSSFGCLFLDHRTTHEDRNLVVHGHNMGLNRTEMFSSLVNYQNPEYAANHETIFYCDPNQVGEERYQVFAVLNLDIYNQDNFNYRKQQFQDDAAFQEFVSYLKEHSIYDGDYVPNGEIIILSTCNRAYGENNRLLICAGRDREV